MVPVICCLVFLFGQSLASYSANQYIDTVVYNALPKEIQIAHLDPTSLPDYTYEYKDKTFFGKVNGKAEYSQGELKGLSKVKRYSECSGPTNTSASTEIRCELMIDTLEASHKGKVKYGKLPKVTIDAKGTVKNIPLNIVVTKPYNQRIQVSVSQMSQGWAEAKFSGLGPLNSQMKVLERNYSDRILTEVSNLVNYKLRYAIEMAANQVPMPTR